VNRPILASLLVLPALAALTVEAAAKDYEIKLERRAKAGQKYRLWATESKNESSKLTKDGKVIQERNRNTKVTLEGIVEVNKVDKEGQSSKLTFTVEKFTNEKGDTVLEKGEVVTAETVEGRTVYKLGDKELDPTVRRQIRGILKTNTKGSLREDKVFGTTTRQQVGASWNVNAKAAAEGLKVDPEAIKGTVKLEEVKTFQDKECLRISAALKISSFPNAELLTKMGYEIKDPMFQVKLSGLFPTDASVESLQRTMGMTMKVEMVGTKGPVKGIVIKTSVKNSGERRRQYLN